MYLTCSELTRREKLRPSFSDISVLFRSISLFHKVITRQTSRANFFQTTSLRRFIRRASSFVRNFLEKSLFTHDHISGDTHFTDFLHNQPSFNPSHEWICVGLILFLFLFSLFHKCPRGTQSTPLSTWKINVSSNHKRVVLEPTNQRAASAARRPIRGRERPAHVCPERVACRSAARAAAPVV